MNRTATPQPSLPFHRRPAVWVVLAAFLLFGAAYRMLAVPPPESATNVELPLPAVADSPYLNTTAAATYVGSAACIRCHEEEHASYLATTHSRSMSVVKADEQAPPAGTVDHRLSKRRYDVVLTEGEMRHRESLPTPDGNLLLSEFPAKYRVGSGKVAFTYIAEDDGFLVESPVTWYSAKQKWDMSPGFDKPVHSSFQRAVNQGCLYCHTGGVTGLGASRERVRIHELAIGCERCHGPGSLHVERHAADSRSSTAPDLTIVNPAHLDRELQEAVCGQCHLMGAARVTPRGQVAENYRPGLPLSDYRLEYRLADGDRDEMTVTGHVEQLHLSRCYQTSDSLTCTTCHDPHHAPPAELRRGAFNAACLGCHTAGQCGAPIADRAPSDDDCSLCHMPSVPTEVPHVAFTQHRIGIHAARRETKSAPGKLTLVPMQDQSALPEPDRLRALGLAYWELCVLHAGDPQYRDCLTRAADLLLAAHDAGIADVETLTALAGLAVNARELEQAEELCRRALEADPTPVQRSDLEGGLAWTLFQQGRLAEARKLYEQLTNVRRDPSDWLLLGRCREQLGEPAAAVTAFERALAIDPAAADIHRRVAALYRQIGQPEQAEQHERSAGLLGAVSVDRGE